MAVDVVEQRVALLLGLGDRLLRQLVLVRQVVDVPLQGVDLLDARLLTGLYLSQTQLSTQ